MKAEDVAMYIIKMMGDAYKDSDEGNAKLNGLLTLVQLTSIAVYGKPLFEDEIIIE